MPDKNLEKWRDLYRNPNTQIQEIDIESDTERNHRRIREIIESGVLYQDLNKKNGNNKEEWGGVYEA